MLHRNTVLRGADLGGTLVFAIEGALAAIEGGLDLMGVMVLAFATALGGGIVRDVLIGATPPAAMRDWHYAAVAFGGGAATFLLCPLMHGFSVWPVIVLERNLINLAHTLRL